MTSQQRTWWKDGTVYQIYPSSFKDSNGDGLGDIPGVISKLDYLKDLGVDIIWLSPMYDSPWVDMGYDIRNYEEVYAPFGTVADMEDLIEECHSRGMRLLLDLVINHTSDEHAWFEESRSSKNNPKRDWYIWKPARYDENGERWPPNNWRTFFSESAWEWDEHTQEYYLHMFAKKQPDLNWDNEDTRNAIYDSAMRFWLDKGVDGFRIDTVNMYSKLPGLPDVPIVDPENFCQPAGLGCCNGPRMHEFLREMNAKVLDNYDTMTVGELALTPEPTHVLRYVGANDRQINMVFQFDLCELGMGHDHKYNLQPWSVSDVRRIYSKWQSFHKGTDGWTTVFLENHDNGRSVSRYASDDPRYRAFSATMLATMITTLTGTLFIYQGQEIGMTNAPRDWPISEYKDIESNNYYNLVAQQTSNDPVALEKAMAAISVVARDHSRLPMQWDGSSPYAGFSSVQPWIRVNDSYPAVNVADQLQSETSVLSFWKKMLRLRKSKMDLFIHGDFHCFGLGDDGATLPPTPPPERAEGTEGHNAGVDEKDRTFVYSKVFGDEIAVVALNFSSEVQHFERPRELLEDKRWADREWRLVCSNYEGEGDSKGRNDGFREKELQPWEGRVYLLER